MSWLYYKIVNDFVKPYRRNDNYFGCHGCMIKLSTVYGITAYGHIRLGSMNLIITSIPSICQWFSTSHMGILSMILSVAATLHNCQLLYNSVAHSSTRKVAMNLTKAILSQNLSPYRSTYHHKPHGKSSYWKKLTWETMKFWFYDNFG